MDPHSQPEPEGQRPAELGPAPVPHAAPAGYVPFDPAPQAGGPNRRRLWLISAVVAAAAALTIAVILANSGGSSRWSPGVEDNFMAQCSATSGGYINTCTCVMHKLESQYSEQDVAAIEGEMASTGQEPVQFQRQAQADAAACR